MTQEPVTTPKDMNVSERLVIRTYESSDKPAVRRLYGEGILGGQLLPNDTGADIDDIHGAYLSSKRTHFWVAELDGRLVGMIGVADDDKQVAEIRRLRVEPALQGHGIGLKLVEKAVRFCHHHGYLKVVLDTRLRQAAAIKTFDKFAFQHHRTRTIQGKEVLEFYLDLYRTPDSHSEPANGEDDNAA